MTQITPRLGCSRWRLHLSVGRKPLFHPSPAPRDDDVARVAASVLRRVERKFADREAGAGQRRFVENAPLLIALADPSARGVVATGPRPGCHIVRVRGPTADVDAFVMGRLCAQVEGYNLQAAARVGERSRASSGWPAISPGRRSRPTGCHNSTTAV